MTHITIPDFALVLLLGTSGSGIRLNFGAVKVQFLAPDPTRPRLDT